MKKILRYLVFIILTGCICFIGCKKEDDLVAPFIYTPPPPPPPPHIVSSNEIIFNQDWELDPVNNIASMVLLPVGFSIDSLLGVYLEVYEMLMPEWIQISKDGTEPKRVFYKIENNRVVLYVINPSYLAFMSVNRTVKLVFS